MARTPYLWKPPSNSVWRPLWRLNVRVGPRDVATFDPERCLRAALGDAIPFRILGEKPWSGHRVVAEAG